jgi:hypothetical protein
LNCKTAELNPNPKELSMKAYLATVCLSLTAIAEPVVVPDFSLKSIFTDDDVVQTDSVWVDDGAALEKTGTGKWTLPLGLIASPGSVDVAVRSGTIAIPSAAGEAPEDSGRLAGREEGA